MFRSESSLTPVPGGNTSSCLLNVHVFVSLGCHVFSSYFLKQSCAGIYSDTARLQVAVPVSPGEPRLICWEVTVGLDLIQKSETALGTIGFMKLNNFLL